MKGNTCLKCEKHRKRINDLVGDILDLEEKVEEYARFKENLKRYLDSP